MNKEKNILKKKFQSFIFFIIVPLYYSIKLTAWELLLMSEVTNWQSKQYTVVHKNGNALKDSLFFHSLYTATRYLKK